MEEQLENLVRRIIFKKFPSLTSVKVLHLWGWYYECKITSDECLSMEEEMEIDTEVKFLLNMLSPDSTKPSKESRVSCFFDCGKGFEFRHTQGYIH
jgi:hypothetical protein